MTLGKITIDNSVKYIAKIEQTQSVSRESKPNKKKSNSFPRKQSKNMSQNNKKIGKNVAAGEFCFLI